jgi:AbrB family looped-hinge helix DNA binding protein
MDAAGRIVIPKSLRDHLGLRAGAVEVVADGAGLRIEPVTDELLEHEGDRLVIPASGQVLTVDDVRALRDADQR